MAGWDVFVFKSFDVGLGAGGRPEEAAEVAGRRWGGGVMLVVRERTVALEAVQHALDAAPGMTAETSSDRLAEGRFCWSSSQHLG